MAGIALGGYGFSASATARLGTIAQAGGRCGAGVEYERGRRAVQKQ